MKSLKCRFAELPTSEHVQAPEGGAHSSLDRSACTRGLSVLSLCVSSRFSFTPFKISFIIKPVIAGPLFSSVLGTALANY